jgi:hypothetical protein
LLSNQNVLVDQPLVAELKKVLLLFLQTLKSSVRLLQLRACGSKLQSAVPLDSRSDSLFLTGLQPNVVPVVVLDASLDKVNGDGRQPRPAEGTSATAANTAVKPLA